MAPVQSPGLFTGATQKLSTCSAPSSRACDHDWASDVNTEIAPSIDMASRANTSGSSPFRWNESALL
jgi:hypothetical protein